MGGERTMRLWVPDLNLQEALWYTVHFLDLHHVRQDPVGVVWLVTGGCGGEGTYRLLATAEARLVEHAATRKWGDSSHEG